MKPLDVIHMKERLGKILAKDEYQVYYKEKQNILQLIVERIKEWIQELLTRLLPDVQVSDTSAEWLSYAIFAAGILAFLLLLFLAWLKFVKDGRMRNRRIGTKEELEKSSADHFKSADQFAENGDLRLAVRHVFLGFVLYLDKGKWITAKEWKTNWEYYEEILDKDSAIAISFKELAILFDEVVYGGHSIRSEDYISYREKMNLVIKRIEEYDRLNSNHHKGGMA